MEKPLRAGNCRFCDILIGKRRFPFIMALLFSEWGGCLKQERIKNTVLGILEKEQPGETDRGGDNMLNFLCGMWAGSTIGVLLMCLVRGGKEGDPPEEKEK